MEAAIVIDGVEITEAQVCAWMIQRMERIRANGLPVHILELSARQYAEGPHTAWNMYAGTECVVSHPSSASAEAKLREQVTLLTTKLNSKEPNES